MKSADTPLRGGKIGPFCRASETAIADTAGTQGRTCQSNRFPQATLGAYSTYKRHIRFAVVEIHDLVLNSHLPSGSPFWLEMCRVGRDGSSGAPGGVTRKQAFAQGAYSVSLCAKVRRSKKVCARRDICGPRSNFRPCRCAVFGGHGP